MPITETISFESLKGIPNKLCWEAKMKDAQFCSYISHWRVPRLWPSKMTETMLLF